MAVLSILIGKSYGYYRKCGVVVRRGQTADAVLSGLEWGLVLEMRVRRDYNTCMSKSVTQYTVRRIPVELDRRLKSMARQKGLSLNSFIVECLAKEASLALERPTYHDLDHLFGKWREDAEFDAIVRGQRRIDEAPWK